ncbi:MAG: hypothetical protein AAGI01_07820 [Myxococcota bacterium]
MGLFDRFFDKDKRQERRMENLKKKITNMYVQAQERQFAIQELRDTGTTEAVQVMLARYDDNNPNTLVDAEEKELVYDYLVRMARDPEIDVVGEVKRYVMEKEVKINWPMKVLSDLLSAQEYVAFVVEIFQAQDTGYQRTTEKKQEMLIRSTELDEPALAEQIARFVADDNETIRFLAVDAAFKQSDPTHIGPALLRSVMEEESGRVINKLVPGLLERRDILVPEEMRDDLMEHLPEGVGIHKDGYLYRRRR